MSAKLEILQGQSKLLHAFTDKFSLIGVKVLLGRVLQD